MEGGCFCHRHSSCCIDSRGTGSAWRGWSGVRLRREEPASVQHPADQAMANAAAPPSPGAPAGTAAQLQGNLPMTSPSLAVPSPLSLSVPPGITPE